MSEPRETRGSGRYEQRGRIYAENRKIAGWLTLGVASQHGLKKARYITEMNVEFRGCSVAKLTIAPLRRLFIASDEVRGNRATKGGNE
jgi:hypothetical protein